MVKYIVLVVSALLVAGTVGKPVDDEESELHVCYSLNCPKETTICGKTSEVSSDDKTKLNVQIKCFDAEGSVLKSENTTETNPWGPNVYYKGTKLTAVVRLTPDYFYLVNPGVGTNHVHAKEDAGPKSEVEDLNS
ncbi:uncharacterized protein LOC126745159 [Anthonomus grandis grandis]|uniref:uncharacterized protein LOC126745159 n=1 Tax=Anthonomus grandis grandis TaxID=2921223 RepID=UPI0021655D81|nr:uncharacterized protein LOC126745159 [Anthonomus grandis grandis]